MIFSKSHACTTHAGQNATFWQQAAGVIWGNRKFYDGESRKWQSRKGLKTDSREERLKTIQPPYRLGNDVSVGSAATFLYEARSNTLKPAFGWKNMPAFWSGMVFYFPVLAFPGFPVFVFTGCMFSPRFSGRSVFPVVKVLSFWRYKGSPSPCCEGLILFSFYCSGFSFPSSFCPAVFFGRWSGMKSWSLCCSSLARRLS